jgi:hypothetical protein
VDTKTLNLLVAALGCGVFVLPTFGSIVAHILTKSKRSFSHVTRPLLHSMVALFRGTLIVAVVMAPRLDEDLLSSSIEVAIAHGLLFAICGLIVWIERDRRLRVDAETGFITWKRLSLPFLKANKVAHIDAVSQLVYESRDLDLFGLDKLEERYSLNYNGNDTVRGHYPKKVIAKLVANFNRYREAFLKYDSETARERRRLCWAEYSQGLGPGRRRAKQRQAERASGQASAEQRAAEEEARIEEEKRREVESKFAP